MSIGLHEVSTGTTADVTAYPRLVADVGGTNVRFALEMAPMRLAHIGVLAGDDYPSLEAAMRTYLAALPREIAATGVRHAAIGIANPVLGDQIRMTNRDWAFSIEAMRQSLGFDTFVVLNDFAALAHALPYLPADELEQVGLDIPQVTKVALALRRRGLPVDTAVYTVEALRDALLRKEGGADAC